MSDRPSRRLFVYGTLLPGDVRWHHLEPFVVDDATDVSVDGDLYDTGLGYPAAIFGEDTRYLGGTIHGRCFQIIPSHYQEALDHLDKVEGVVGGHYRRLIVAVHQGGDAWAYGYGGGLDLMPVPTGRWTIRNEEHS